MEKTLSPVIAAAQEYTERGWQVFECHGIRPPGWGIKVASCTCPLGTSCRHPGKHPRNGNGFRGATTDPEAIRRWRPDSNVAIATGATNAFFVVDIDPRHGGFDTLAKLEAEHGRFSRDAVVFTGGRGIHLYYRYPKKGAPKGSGAGVFGPGIDLKGNDGYIIAPPSLHFALELYHWRGGQMPAVLPTAPEWLVAMARENASSSRNIRRSEFADIRTADHPLGQKYARFLKAIDRGSYWKIECPAGKHETGDAAMYPREYAGVRFACFSGNRCTHEEIAQAVQAMMEKSL
jgi:hypothetical protein